jgi:hypothetical protein
LPRFSKMNKNINLQKNNNKVNSKKHHRNNRSAVKKNNISNYIQGIDKEIKEKIDMMLDRSKNDNKEFFNHYPIKETHLKDSKDFK